MFDFSAMTQAIPDIKRLAEEYVKNTEAMNAKMDLIIENQSKILHIIDDMKTDCSIPE